MKVKISYYIPIEKELEMTPEEYCYVRADGVFHGKKVFPDDAIYRCAEISDQAEDELLEYWFSKK